MGKYFQQKFILEILHKLPVCGIVLDIKKEVKVWS